MYVGPNYTLFQDTRKPVKSRWEKPLPSVRFGRLATKGHGPAAHMETTTPYMVNNV